MTKERESTFSHTWFDDGFFGEVVLHCKCGVDTEVGTVDRWEDILKCKSCRRKYKIRMKIYLEEIKEDEYSPCKEAEKKIVGKKDD